MASNPEKYIGKQYGIYKIIELLPEKDKYHHYVYLGECQECGFQKTGTINDFKNKNVQHCTHWGILTDEQRYAWYQRNKRQCLFCGCDIPMQESFKKSEYKERLFCSQSCATSYNNKLTKRKNVNVNHCVQCGQVIPARGKYCSTQCQALFRQQQYITRWKQGLESGLSGEYNVSRRIKRYLMEKFDCKCSQCRWGETNPFTGNIPLEVHHKDGNYLNNSEDNLDLLCPNCHALTETYKASNVGSGRKNRSKYSQFNTSDV
jgi:predicted nucleic acid-binding Zn ribbon protein